MIEFVINFCGLAGGSFQAGDHGVRVETASDTVTGRLSLHYGNAVSSRAVCICHPTIGGMLVAWCVRGVRYTCYSKFHVQEGVINR